MPSCHSISTHVQCHSISTHVQRNLCDVCAQKPTILKTQQFLPTFKFRSPLMHAPQMTRTTIVQRKLVHWLLNTVMLLMKRRIESNTAMVRYNNVRDVAGPQVML